MTDPYRLLGVADTADDQLIRVAYLAAIRAFPPERDRRRFEQLRAAYEAIATERDRLAHALFDTTAPTVQEVIELLSADWRPRRPGVERLRRILGRK
jgi:curved DNA-binding protein CbpA